MHDTQLLFINESFPLLLTTKSDMRDGLARPSVLVVHVQILAIEMHVTSYIILPDVSIPQVFKEQLFQ